METLVGSADVAAEIKKVAMKVDEAEDALKVNPGDDFLRQRLLKLQEEKNLLLQLSLQRGGAQRGTRR